jgi:hypothetical protein
VSIRDEWIVLDTNIWIFGLRQSPEFPACADLLRSLDRLQIVVPRQILQELQANLGEAELRALFRLLHRLPTLPNIDWQKAASETVAKYQQMGCKLGDAVICAHLEEQNIKTLAGLPFRTITSNEAFAELNTASSQ